MDVEVGGGESVPTHLTHQYLLNVIASLATHTDLVQYTVPVLTDYLQNLHGKGKTLIWPKLKK